MESKDWWKSKTLWTGVLLAIVGVLELMQKLPDVPALVVTAAGVLVVVFRAMANTTLKT